MCLESDDKRSSERLHVAKWNLFHALESHFLMQGPKCMSLCTEQQNLWNPVQEMAQMHTSIIMTLPSGVQAAERSAHAFAPWEGHLPLDASPPW